MDSASKLWIAYNESRTDENRNALVVHYLDLYGGLIFNQAHRIALDIDEIKSSAAVGLMEAVERFDPAAKASFRTWAVGLIRNRISDYCREIDPMSRTLRQFKNRRDSCNSDLPEEQAVEMGLSLDRFNHLSRELYLSMSLLFPAGGTTLAVEWYGIDRVDEVFEPDERIYLLRDFLPKIQFDVLLMYYKHNMTYRQIGSIYSRTESRMCQIGKKTARNLGIEYLQKAS